MISFLLKFGIKFGKWDHVGVEEGRVEGVVFEFVHEKWFEESWDQRCIWAEFV